jgi:hypothetical protein
LKPAVPAYAIAQQLGTEYAKERLLQGVTINPKTGCWERSGCMENGYTRVRFSRATGGRAVLAHRLSWAIANKAEPGDMFVCHSCDVRHCVNPDHLWLGTALDNTRDMAAKGRRARQTAPRKRVRGSKLTIEDVELIRSSSLTNVRLAELFGVVPETISKIKTGYTWSDQGRARRRARKVCDFHARENGK